MKEINKEFDSMKFLEELYEIDKQIIEEYERLKDEVKEGETLENLNLLKLKILITIEKILLNRLSSLSKNKLEEISLMIEPRDIPVEIQVQFDIDQSRGFEFDLECPKDKEIRNRMRAVTANYGLINGKFYITCEVKVNDKNETIKLATIPVDVAITAVEHYLLVKEQILGLKVNYGLEDEIIKELYTDLNIELLRKSSIFPYLEMFLIYNRPNIKIDDEINELMKLLKLQLNEQQRFMVNDGACFTAIGSINQLLAIELKSDDIDSIYSYIWSMAHLELALKSCDGRPLDNVIEHLETRSEDFENEQIKVEVFNLVKKAKNKSKQKTLYDMLNNLGNEDIGEEE